MSSADSSDLQSWCEVPSIAHFCSLFRQAFDLLEFDIQELEESLLLMGTEDDTTKLVLRLLIKLLRGCSKSFTSNINEDNYNTYLRRLFLSKREDAEEDKTEFNFDCTALVDDDVDFPDLPLRERVLILQQLCEFRLDAEDVFDKLRNLEASSLRVDPLGTDSENVTYWYFYGTRLYKEIPPSKEHEHKAKKHSKEKEKKKKKKEKKKKKDKKKKRGDSVSSAEDEDAEPTATWSVACLTLQDWEDLTAKYKKSKKKTDRDLYETLNDNFLPEIVKMFIEKDKEDRRRLLLMQPKRSSGRLEYKRREQEERDRELAMKMEEERRIEEEYDEKLRLEREAREREEQELSREERRKQRELMKEMRAQRASEREVAQAIALLKEQQGQAAAKRREKYKHQSDEEVEEKDTDELFVPPPQARVSKSDEEDDEVDEEEESHRPSNGRENSRESRVRQAKSNFTNALLRAGTKSTKDVALDKPVRKMPGLLLETAGRSLMQKRATHEESSSSAALSKTVGGLSFGLVSSKISFGLYDGHLPIDHSSYTKSSDDGESDSDRGSIEPTTTSTMSTLAAIRGSDPVRPVSGLGGAAISNLGGASTKKVFSNWGGEFFKKNLDYRANTNKILEKMNLNLGGGSGVAPPPKASNGDSTGSERFKSSLMSVGGGTRMGGSFGTGLNASSGPGGAKRTSIDSISSNESSPAKKMKTSSLFDSYA